MERREALVDVLREKAPGLMLIADAPLADLTTLKLGGPADVLVCPKDAMETAAALSAAADCGVPVTVMGCGSNLLISDSGIRGLVIRIAENMADIAVNGPEMTCGAGAALSVLAQEAARRGLGGLSFAGGIPGAAGGAVVMNAGAYGGEMADAVTFCEGVRLNGEPFCYTKDELALSYRHSRLMEEDCIVTRVGFRLHEADPAALAEEMRELARKRREKQPLTEHSAGSTFKRPAGDFAARLIESCGLKGFAVGGASVSEKHAGFCINRDGTAADFRSLMRQVRDRVEAETGIRLEPEVRMLGFDDVF